MSLNPLSQNWGPVQRHSQSLWTEEARKHINEALVSYPNFEDWRQRSSVFAHLAFSTAGAATISGTDVPERIDIAGCSANFFSVFGVSPVLGRVFSPSEFEGRQSVALISYSLWQRRFGGESDAVGKSIRIDEGNATVIGILPPSFTFPSATTDLWQPLSAERNWTEVRAERQRPLGVVIGRLRPGISLSEAQANMNVIGPQLARQHPELTNNPDFAGFHVRVISLADQIAGPTVRTQL